MAVRACVRGLWRGPKTNAQVGIELTPGNDSKPGVLGVGAKGRFWMVCRPVRVITVGGLRGLSMALLVGSVLWYLDGGPCTCLAGSMVVGDTCRAIDCSAAGQKSHAVHTELTCVSVSHASLPCCSYRLTGNPYAAAFFICASAMDRWISLRRRQSELCGLRGTAPFQLWVATNCNQHQAGSCPLPCRALSKRTQCTCISA